MRMVNIVQASKTMKLKPCKVMIIILLQNHPDGLPPSASDIQTAIAADAQQLQIVSTDANGQQNIHILTRPETGWPAGLSAIVDNIPLNQVSLTALSIAYGFEYEYEQKTNMDSSQNESQNLWDKARDFISNGIDYVKHGIIQPVLNVFNPPEYIMGQNRDNNVNIPDAPTPPIAPTSGDGSGIHGSAGDPTEADRTVYSTMEQAAFFAGWRGYWLTSSHMQHYLGNSGDPLDIDVDKLINPEFQLYLDQQFQDEIVGQVEEQIRLNGVDTPTEFEVTTTWWSSDPSYYPSKEDYPDFYYGIGGFSHSQTAYVTVIPNPDGGNPIVTIQYQIHMFDRYNWDAGKSVTIPSANDILPSWVPLNKEWLDDNTILGDYIPDSKMARLHQVGIAQEYELHGSSSTIEIMYEYEVTTDRIVPISTGGR